MSDPAAGGFFERLKHKLDPDKDADPKERLSQEIKDFHDQHQLTDPEFSMLQGILNFQQKTAREVMVPRTDAFMIDMDDPFSKNLDEILREPYSRIPVYQGDKDHIVGVIHIRNVLRRARQVGFDKLDYQDVMGEALFAPETTLISDLLVEMQDTQRQLAILLDEFGGVTGLATIEDLIEEIVGDIDDEVDQTEVLFTKLNNQQYIIHGKMLLDDFNEEFGTDLEMEDVDTVAGYMITTLGVIPAKGEKLSVKLDNGMVLTTRRMKGSRLSTVLLTIPDKLTQQEEEADED
ncbi:hemolysin family protein [Lactobacillus corticis]|uniref:Hemolysin-like protein n=1 Tax=Lactobacillus corticis TaxID=2201249 RepID=A0A916QFA8_9LACO|nr:hemolysin family protein [Lactobacillus corticis]GFZ26231.1 hemolysin-like protein [Lactobacillus corticis]